MAVQLQVTVRVLHGDGAVMAHTERAFTTMNPVPRDIVNDADLGKELLEQTLSQMEREAGEQLDRWKAATVSILGGGTP